MSSSGDGAVALAAWNVACGQLAMQTQALAKMVCGSAVELEGLCRCIYERPAGYAAREESYDPPIYRRIKPGLGAALPCTSGH
jgi:hypothetical protein